MTEEKDKILKKVKTRKIILPLLIGFGYAGYKLYTEFDPSAFLVLKFTWYMLFWITLSILMMVMRDVGYMIRIKILTGKEISWKSAFNIIMLWEFTSAITPSVVGGTSLAVLFIHKEGVSMGKSTAVVMATSFLDELYFVTIFPLIFILVSGHDLFIIKGDVSTSYVNTYFYFAIIGYFGKFLWTCLMAYGLFVNPEVVKRFLLFIFRLPYIRRWKSKIEKMGEDMKEASSELKKKPFLFWVKAYIASFFAWSSRYWIVNFLLLALVFGLPDPVQSDLFEISQHIKIFARQLVMWIMMLIMPTPGGAGFAEEIFGGYMGEFIPVGMVTVMGIMWRLVTYYPYLLIGPVVVSKWIKKVYST